MEKLQTYRIALFATLGLLLALVSSQSRDTPTNRHPLCELHPTLTSLCVKLRPPSSPTYPTDVLNLTRALIAIPSESGTEQAAFAYAHAWLKASGWRVTSQQLPPFAAHLPPRQNLLALQQNAELSSVRVVLCTHLDTVPGAGRGAHLPVMDGLVLRGRGSVDAKAQAAAMLVAGTALRDVRVAVLLVSGEETDHAGIIAAGGLGLPEDVVLVNGEPTESKVATVQKGSAKVVVRVAGLAAHSGYPELGESATEKIVDVLHELGRVSWPVAASGERTTMNVGTLEGGVAGNVVAPSAEALLFFRLVGEPGVVLAEVERVVGRYENVSVEVLKSVAPLAFFVPPGVAEEMGTTSVAYGTDVPYYQGKYAAAVLFGGGSITTAHTEDEYMSVDELILLPERLRRISVELLETDIL